MSFVIRSGQVSSGTIGNAAVLSGSIGSGQIGSGHMASGFIAGLQSGGAGLVSGQVTSGFIGDNAVVSGSIASGQISDLHFASGANINEANWLAFSGLIAGELISGGKAVTIQSGTGLVFRTGFNPLSGILVYGLVPDIAASGQPVKVYTQGPVFMGAISGLISGKVGAPFAYTGNGIVGIGGPTVIGTVFSGSIVNLTIPFILSGTITGPLIASGAIQQGQLSTLPAAVLPANIASGVIVDTAFQLQAGGASGAFNFGGPFVQTSQAISGGRAVSFDTATATVHFSQIRIAQAGIPATMPAFGIVIDNVASGDFVNAHTHGYVAAPLLSGLLSGQNGQPIYVNTSGDLSITQPTNSGALVQALGVAVHDTLFGNLFGIELVSQPWSGSVSKFQLASGVLATALSSGQVTSGFLGDNSVVSGSIASGQVSHFHIAANSIQSGQVASGQLTSGTAASGFFGGIGTNQLDTDVFTNLGTMNAGTAVHPFASGVVATSDHTILGGIPTIGFGHGGIVSGTSGATFYHIAYPDGGISQFSGTNTIGFPVVVNSGGTLTTLDKIASGVPPQIVGVVGDSSAGPRIFFYPVGTTSGSIFSWNIASGAITSGAIASGQIAANHLSSGLLANSGLILTQFKTVELISGGRCVTVVASGLVGISKASNIGSGMPCIGVVYDNVLSGQFANILVAGAGPDVPAIEGGGGITAPGRDPVYVGTSGLLSLRPGSGALVVEIGTFSTLSGGAIINVVPLTSGGFGAYQLGSGAVQSGNIASGTIGHFMISSGGVEGTGLSGIPSNIASGSIGTNDIATNTILHPQLNVGPNAPYTATMAWGVAIGPNNIITGQGGMSGGAVAFLTPTTANGYPVVPAERNSGLRLPAIGVMASGAASGQNAVVVTHGFVARDFFMASGYTGQPVYVGSGGFIVTQSGGLGATFSGAGLVSGGSVQRIGVLVSGGMFVNVDMNITSGFNSTPAGTF